MSQLKAVALVCTLKPSPAESSSQLLAEQILRALEEHDVAVQCIRVADRSIPPGVEHKVSDSDEWPEIRAEVLESDIVVICTPIWLGHPSSLAQRVLERLNADLSETQTDGRPIMWDKIGLVGVVGNEDGAHKVISDLFQGMNDLGFTIPAYGGVYWVGEARGGTDYLELSSVPESVAGTLGNMTRNAVHLARLLRSAGYPGD